ncbi:MAG: metallophosphoesterase [Leptospirales bacterium]|nr:metallophosphoesterase [Leptospirales bacterium]
MPRIFHFADLHLSAAPAEHEYSLSTLTALCKMAREAKADLLTIGGDLFNTFEDIAPLRKTVGEILRSCDAPAFFLPGNHESLRQIRGQKLEQFNLGEHVEFLSEGPATFLQREFGGHSLQIVAVPHSSDYAALSEWKAPAPPRGLRIALAHGIVAGMAYSGPDEEKDAPAGVLEAAHFARWECQLALLGHIHAGREQTIDGVRCAYPGSARVWRRGESGPREALLIDWQGREFSLQRIAIAAAGQYRTVETNILPEGNDFDCSALSWEPEDTVEIRWNGMVESDDRLDALERKLRETAPPARRIDFTRDRDRCLVAADVVQLPSAVEFLRLWQQGFEQLGGESNAETIADWRRARALGLKALHDNKVS